MSLYSTRSCLASARAETEGGATGGSAARARGPAAAHVNVCHSHAGRSRSRLSAAQLGGRSLLTHTNFTGNSCQLVPVSFDHERIFRGPNAIDLAVSLIDEHAHSCFMPCGSIRSGHGTCLVHRGAASPVCSADVDNIQLLRGARRIRRLPDTYCWRWRGAHWTMSSTRKIISAASVEDRTTWDFTL